MEHATRSDFSQDKYCPKERETTEAEIDKMGGFKQFVVARFVSERGPRAPQKTSFRIKELSPEVYDMKENPFSHKDVLTLVRLHGSLVFWSRDPVLVLPREVQITPRHREIWATVALSPLAPAEILEDSLKAWRTRDGDKDSRRHLIELLSALSVEVYVCKREGFNYPGAAADYPDILYGGFEWRKQGKLEELGKEFIAWRNCSFLGFSSKAVQSGSSTMGSDSYLRVEFGTPPRWTFHWDEEKESSVRK